MRFRYRSEEEMKDSGVEWIGKIPREWKISKLKYFLCIDKGNIKVGPFGSQLKNEDMNGDYANIYTQRNVIDNNFTMLTDKVSKEKYEQLKGFTVEKGDMLVTTRGTIGKVAIVPENIELGILHPCLIKMKIDKEKYDSRLLSIIFNETDNIKNQIKMQSNTTIMEVIYSETLKNLIITQIPSYLQDKILKFLEDKALQFDTIISKKEALIQTLEEAKKSLISEVVTGKVKVVKTSDGYELVERKKEEMKDSGVEWLGDVPNEWCVGKLKHLVSNKITDGPHETPTLIDNGIPFLSAEAIVNSEVSMPNMRGYISEEQYQIYAKKSRVYKNDILFCKSGSTTGKSALVKNNDVFGIWSPLAIIRANKDKINFKSLFYVIQSIYFRTQVENYWTFGTQPNIGMATLENLYIPYTKNLSEQNNIVKFLDKKIEGVNEIINNTKHQIQKLKEAKQSIISEAVTGKIEILDEI